VSKELVVSGGEPLFKWVQQTLEPTGITVKNWISSWANGRTIYALFAIALPSGLDLSDSASLSPADRESRVILVCQSLNIATYLVPRDIIIVRMLIQEVYGDTKNPPTEEPKVESVD
jgi:hypothetical protein